MPKKAKWPAASFHSRLRPYAFSAGLRSAGGFAGAGALAEAGASRPSARQDEGVSELHSRRASLRGNGERHYRENARRTAATSSSRHIASSWPEYREWKSTGRDCFFSFSATSEVILWNPFSQTPAAR